MIFMRAAYVCPKHLVVGGVVVGVIGNIAAAARSAK